MLAALPPEHPRFAPRHLMSPRPLFVLALAGCAALSRPPAPPADPVNAAAAVKVALVAAVEHAGTDAAIRDWQTAYRQFERDVEPVLRRHCGRHATTEIEYRFGGAQRALDGHGSALDHVNAIQDALDQCIETLAAGR